MKLTTFLLLISAFSVCAGISYSQTISLSVAGETLKEVLSQVEDLSGCNFMYSEKFIDVSKKVSINVENKKIEDVLNSLFAGTDIQFERKDRIIILSNSDSKNEWTVYQQLRSVFGKVTDPGGQPLPGVTVVIKGTTQGTITDADGNYTLSNVPSDAILIFSFVGMRSKEILVTGKSNIDMIMEEETVGIEEVVAVGYGTQKRATLTGSVSSVRSQELTVAPVASSSNALTGRLPGLISVQEQGLPGADAATLRIRGFGNPLVIVDGIEANLNILDPNTIESVSILKDGAASIYGSRAGNGVILVTTKRGAIIKPTFTFNTSFSGQGVTYMPDKLSAGQYAEIEREKWIQSGKPEETAPYTVEEIQKYYDGSDPNYPNTDWKKELVRDWAPQQQHNLNVRGGSERIKYFGFLGFLDQETMWKKNGGNYKRYNFQSNVDLKILDNMDLQVDVSAIIQDRKFPWRPQDIATNGTWLDYWGTRPNVLSSTPDPAKLPYVGSNYPIYVTSNYNLIGYDQQNNQRVTGTITLNYRFKDIQGLSARVFVNYLKDNNSRKRFRKGNDFWNYEFESDSYTLAASTVKETRLDMDYSGSRNMTGQFSLNYDRAFHNDHHLTILALYETIDYRYDTFSAGRGGYLSTAIDLLYAGSTGDMSNAGSASEMGRTSYIGRLNYAYKDKYLLESSIRADASAKFPADNRWGYFPSVSLGWRISEENFMADHKIIDNLKLRASFGQSGNDGVGNFQYLTGYSYKTWYGTYLFGSTTYAGIYSTGLPNPNLTWEEITIYNAGLDFSLWKGKLYGETDAFYRERSGIPATRILSLPSTFGANLPPENINSLNDRGFDLKLGTSGKYNDLTWDISGNISWSRSKWMHYEEPDYEDQDQERINKLSGRWTDRAYGYVFDGLFISQEEIDNLDFDQDLQGNITLRPGDVRYVNVNGDEKLDWKDQIEIGKGTIPHWMAGLNTVFTYKNFDLSTLWQGAFGYYKNVNINEYMNTFYELRWKEETNNPDALVPRLGGASQNGLYSDYRYRKAGYLRLKTASLGYNLPRKWVSKVNISNMRIYCAGTNLLTFDKLKKYGIDPEAPSGYAGYYYPQQRTVTIGATISF